MALTSAPDPFEALALLVGEGVGLGLEVAELADELRIAIQAFGGEGTVADGGQDGAAGLGLVGAVGEAARGGQVLDLGEGRGDPLGAVPQLQLAQAGRVQDQATAGPDDQLAAGRRVPTGVTE